MRELRTIIMKEQLHLSVIKLLELGFKGRNIDGDDFNPSKRVYEINIINGKIYYNPEQKEYAWYCMMQIENAGNNCLLDIQNIEELKTLLKIFKCSLE